MGMVRDFILIEQLSMRLESETIFEQVDFNIAQGEAVAIIGANGSGKSTLLKILLGLLQPNSGKVSIAGLQYGQADMELKLRQLISFAPDTPPLYANDTVTSYLKFIAQLKLVPKSEITARINDCLEIFGLTEMRDSYIYTLSKGTQQRVNLAQAAISKPQILVLDEPTNALDTRQCEKFCNYLSTLKKQGITLIIASHQYTDIILLCDYMLRLHNKTSSKILTPLDTKELNLIHDQIYHST